MADEIDPELRAMLTRIKDGELSFRCTFPFVGADRTEWETFQKTVDLIMELSAKGFISLQPWKRNPHPSGRTPGFDAVHVRSLTTEGRQALAQQPRQPKSLTDATAGAVVQADAELAAPEIEHRAIVAWEQFQRAAEALGKDQPSDREAYDVYRKMYEESGKGNPLPSFDTWRRYLRIYREATGQQKRTPRSQKSLGTRTIVHLAER